MNPLCENDTPYFLIITLGCQSMIQVIQENEWDTTSKMGLRTKPHPAVALILQHLWFEAHAFDVVGSAGEEETW